MKKVLSLSIVMLLCLNIIIPSAVAAEYNTYQETETIWFADGSHAEITTTHYSHLLRSTAKSDKTYTYWNNQGQKVFSYTLYAEFTYNGVTSSATKAFAAADYYLSGWTLSSHDEYCSGSTAYGDATFKGPGGASEDVSLTLTCDKNGNIT